MNTTAVAALGFSAAAAVAAGTATFIDGQRHDATPTSGDGATWNRKVVGAQLVMLGAIPASAGAFALSKAVGASNPGYVGFATLMSGMAGATAGNFLSMIVD